MKTRLHPGLAALFEVGIMFLPAIPAYLWMWPNVKGAGLWVAQIITYVYVLAGTLWIGLRRWNLGKLGINKDGLLLSLACGSAILAGRLLIILAIDWGFSPPNISLPWLTGQVLYYFGLVGLVEELLFRGLVYRALGEWRGERWAIWGSSIGFVLWHIFGQGPLMGAAALFIGLLFALIRWRGGGILGLIVLHALWDLQSVLLVSGSNKEIFSVGRQDIIHPAWIILGYAMILIVAVYLWKVHPMIKGVLDRSAG